MLSAPSDQRILPSGPTRGGNCIPRPKTLPGSNAGSVGMPQLLLLPEKCGNGKQVMKKGTQWKMMSSRLTMIISRINAQMVIIGMEIEHSSPIEMLESFGSGHAPELGVGKS